MRPLMVRDIVGYLFDALKFRAMKHSRSAETEDFWKEAARLRDELAGRRLSDSTETTREARDRRFPI
jgi:plasmid stability protein